MLCINSTLGTSFPSTQVCVCVCVHVSLPHDPPHNLCSLLPTENWHITEIRPFGMNPCPRRRVGCAKVGSEILICGGTSPHTVIRDGKEREILHDHNDVYILHLSKLSLVSDPTQSLNQSNKFNITSSLSSPPLSLPTPFSPHPTAAEHYGGDQRETIFRLIAFHHAETHVSLNYME